MKLSQIQVAEVSLVDKAANKRRYLLYKRDDTKLTPEQLFKAAKDAFDGIVELLKGKNEGAPNEQENYAKQAKDLLNGYCNHLVSFYTDEERSALAKTLAKSAPPPKDDKTGKADDELEFSDEEIKQLESLDKAVDSLQQQLADRK